MKRAHIDVSIVVCDRIQILRFHWINTGCTASDTECFFKENYFISLRITLY